MTLLLLLSGSGTQALLTVNNSQIVFVQARDPRVIAPFKNRSALVQIRDRMAITPIRKRIVTAPLKDRRVKSSESE